MLDRNHHLDSLSCESIAERLKRHPHLQTRILSLLDVVDNAVGDAVKADEAEQRVFDELRLMGQEALQAWAERKHSLIESESDKRSDLTRKEKKVSTGTPVLEK